MMKKKKTILTIIAIILIIPAVFSVRYVLAMKNKPQTVNIDSIAKKDLSVSISVSGTIEPNDFHEIYLSPTQKVFEVYVKENQEIEKGDKLIKLDITDLEYSLKKGQLAMELSQKDLEDIKNNESSKTRLSLENSVKQGELSLESAQLRYEDALGKLEQNQKLYDLGHISKDEIRSLEMTLKDLDNNVINAEILLNNAKLALEDYLDSENSIFRQEKQIEISKTDLDNLKRNIANSLLKSDIKGTVVKIDAKQNQYPNQGDKITIHDLSCYKLKVKVNQYDAVGLEEGQEAIIKVKGLNKEYKGKVEKIARTAVIDMSGSNIETKIEAEIIIDNPDEKIKVGYEADAEIFIDSRQDALAVSFDSLLTDEKGKKFLYVAEDNIVKKKYVETGIESDFDIEILSGIKEGESYIINPPSDLKEGETITVNGGI